ncbi:Uncharacterised protein [Segatella copri]|nr:Uncharacterised protein [Segatella copri]
MNSESVWAHTKLRIKRMEKPTMHIIFSLRMHTSS